MTKLILELELYSSSCWHSRCQSAKCEVLFEFLNWSRMVIHSNVGVACSCSKCIVPSATKHVQENRACSCSEYRVQSSIEHVQQNRACSCSELIYRVYTAVFLYRTASTHNRTSSTHTTAILLLIMLEQAELTTKPVIQELV